MLPKASIVDDDELIRSIASETLAECGFDIVAAENVEQAIGQLECHDNSISIVVTDVRMPGPLNGAALSLE